ncbi:uncharacterized protein LTR77_006976 [Saxophila tyrrhenica]|uniref:Peptidase A1 domain-containing protein n=1 Tax=Saxophila tyrrhenica TaxID=1690608 RepID=A0AAV9PAH8_9PEZI|nr:hypothetical protein LTR77_006976 [Saxophila tyrrhenica]
MPTIKKSFATAVASVAFSGLLPSLHVQAHENGKTSAVLPLKAAYYGNTFNAEVTLGDQSFELLVDTGSADLWVLGDDWECIRKGADAREGCDFGTETYSPSSTYKPVDYAWLGEHYGNGDVIGPLGRETMRLGDITIPNQIFGVINSSTTVGDRVNTGIMGLGHPILAQAHPNSYHATSGAELLVNRIAYNTVFWHMIDRGVEPYYALALDRGSLGQETGKGGYLSFGTLSPVDHGPFITVPNEVTKAIPRSFTDGKRKISFWTVTVQSVSWDDKTGSKPFQAIIDSGNWANVLPPKLASRINAAFEPPGKLDKKSGYFKVDCDATPPADVKFEIGNQKFSINSADMIWRDWDGSCYSTVEGAETSLGVDIAFLGVAFLKNVVSVFDVGNEEIRLAARTEECP